MKISNAESRVLHLNSLMLWEKPGKVNALDIIRKLSYLQIDAIYSIARSQDIVLHNRSTSYKEEDIWKLLKTNKVFEGFAHARCLVPMYQLPYFYAKMIRKRDQIPEWYQSVAKHLDWQAEVLDAARNKKEIGVKDITIPENFPQFTGWTHAPKRMLDYLSTRGYLFSSQRKKFQAFYQIPETMIDNFDTLISNLPTREEELLFHIRTTLDATGPTPLHRLLHYKYIHTTLEIDGKKVSPRNLVKKYLKDGTLSTIQVEGSEGKIEDYILLPKQVETMSDIQQHNPEDYNCFILSPFDNSLWSRESLFAQYNFNYKMEVYVPANKRVYGFFTLPILYGPDFVGRVDVKLDRKTKVFYWLKWSWEPIYKQVKANPHFWKKLTETVERFVRFHGVDKTNFGNISKTQQKKMKSLMEIQIVQD